MLVSKTMMSEWIGGCTDRHFSLLPPRFFLSLQAFCFFVLLGLVVVIVWAVLWYLLKWYLVLKNRYEGDPERPPDQGEEQADL